MSIKSERAASLMIKELNNILLTESNDELFKSVTITYAKYMLGNIVIVATIDIFLLILGWGWSLLSQQAEGLSEIYVQHIITYQISQFLGSKRLARHSGWRDHSLDWKKR